MITFAKIITIVILIIVLIVIPQIVPTFLNNDFTLVAVSIVAIISIIKQLQDIAKFTDEKYPNEEYKKGTAKDKFWMNYYFITSHGFEYSIKFIMYLALVIALFLQFRAAYQRIHDQIDLKNNIHLLQKQVHDLNTSNNELLKAYTKLKANKSE